MDTNNIGIHVWPFHKEIKVALLNENAIPPTRNHWSDAGIDFYSLRDVIIPPYTCKHISTGITVEIPFGFFGLLKEKGKSRWLIGAGVVDEGYQGEIIFKVYNPTNDGTSILRGQAVGQMVLIPIIRPEIAIYSIDEIHKEETERGNSGGILEEL